MKPQGLYTSGEFARKAHVSIRTIRFYDKQNILKPSFVNESKARFYSDEDFARLQQILLLKYLGFSLEEIRTMTIDDSDYHILYNSLQLQQKLVQDKIEQLQLVERAIKNTSDALVKNHSVDWSQMLDIIHLTSMENSLQIQYQNATNISARINLHQMYSHNKKGWFPWVYEQCHINSGYTVLELGCGSGTLWTANRRLIPDNTTVILSDISEGMLRDTKRDILQTESDILNKEGSLSSPHFEFNAFDCHNIPYEDNSFDLVIANHVLFYCDNIAKVCEEVNRVLKPNGCFICSTYGSNHMKEISQLVTEFDERIVLSADKLYEKFGLENGTSILSPYFKNIKTVMYDDYLLVNDAQPLIEYILSCHGNQNQYLLDKYSSFRAFITEKTRKGLYITKEAGTFICRK